MAYKDYYQILGVDKTASQQEIKKAYKRLARKHHPDVNPNDKTAEGKFKAINEAYQVIGKVENRKKYDQLGEHWQHAGAQNQSGTQRGQSQHQYSGGASEADFAEFFESVFGQQTGTSGGRYGFGGSATRFKGEDIQAELNLLLTDVVMTHKRTLSVNGKNIRISIPAGVENGQRIKLKGFGGKGVNGGPDGDLYVRFKINNNTAFRREKNHLYKTFELDLYTAVLGGEVLVDTLDGQVKLKVPAGTQNNSQVKLKGKGFPLYKKDQEKGDLYINYVVKIPKDLSAQEIDLFKQLKALS
ncbi:DnaJ C-terminal domain-containing protein [Marinicella litoralis]|uniref:Curved DNA-binding protein n=1 Tax=Marinicella litoralis TaxID=644220 RepID=A0A4R6XN39_9GAMM|nr:J domain-containing protein [Marinicella litoralis]TDR19354.1 curved DNA-binding protein [Marinicella litoralis]